MCSSDLESYEEPPDTAPPPAHVDAIAIASNTNSGTEQRGGAGQGFRRQSTSKSNNSLPLSTPDSEDMLQKLEDEADAEDKIEEQPEPEQPSPTPQMRDDHGQSVLHFAASRPGGAQTIYSFLQSPNVNLAWRDENLKTARDVAAQTGRTENLKIIDSFVVGLAVQGDVESLQRLLLDGYDHLTGIEDMSRNKIQDAARNQPAVLDFLNSIEVFSVKLQALHHTVRMGSLDQVKK